MSEQTENFDPDARLPLGTKIKRVHSEDERLPLGTKLKHVPAHNDVSDSEDKRLPLGTTLHNLIKTKILDKFKS